MSGQVGGCWRRHDGCSRADAGTSATASLLAAPSIDAPTCAALTSRSTSMERLGVRMRVNASSTACVAVWFFGGGWACQHECQRTKVPLPWVAPMREAGGRAALSAAQPPTCCTAVGHASEGAQLAALQARAHALNDPAGQGRAGRAGSAEAAARQGRQTGRLQLSTASTATRSRRSALVRNLLSYIALHQLALQLCQRRLNIQPASAPEYGGRAARQ